MTRLSHAPVPSFWVLQIGGWLAYYVAMTLSRVGMFPLRYMIISKGILAVLGFAITLCLRSIYRPMARRGSSIVTLVVVSVAASYLLSLVWTGADHLIDRWIVAASGGSVRPLTSPVQLFNGAVYNAFTLLAWSLLYFGIKYHAALQNERERSLRAEALANRAQLETLRYQLNPHFLFNSLNAVSTLVVEHRNDEAARMLARVSDFLRLTLAAPAAEEVPLADELDFVGRYLEIEQVRFGDRLRTHLDLAPEARAAVVPSFILQPLVENAVRYAVAPREQGGSIVIQASRRGGAVRIVVSDDGPGLAAATAPNGSARIGLANTRERLRQLYGSAGYLTLSDAPGGGLEATIEIPYRAARAPGAPAAHDRRPESPARAAAPATATASPVPSPISGR